MECAEVGGGAQVQFLNFSRDEIDSVLIVSYNRRYYQINLPTDSLIALVGSDSTISPPFVYFPSKIDFRLDYKIKIFPSGDSYNLSNFLTKKEVCNRCFLGNDYYTQLASYTVDGKTQQGPQIKIYK
jgi:hypothetical protein